MSTDPSNKKSELKYEAEGKNYDCGKNMLVDQRHEELIGIFFLVA